MSNFMSKLYINVKKVFMFSYRKIHEPTFWFLWFDDSICLTRFTKANLILGCHSKVQANILFEVGDFICCVHGLDFCHFDPLFRLLFTFLYTVTCNLRTSIVCRWFPFKCDIIRSNSRSSEILWWAGWSCKTRTFSLRQTNLFSDIKIPIQKYREFLPQKILHTVNIKMIKTT